MAKRNISNQQKNANKSKLTYWLIGFCLIVLGIGYFILFKSNTSVKENTYLKIKTGSSFNEVISSLEAQKLIKDTDSFKLIASLLGYNSENIKPGRYEITPNMGNFAIVTMLKGGKQSIVKLQFTNIRLKNEFCGFVGTQLETDSTQLLQFLSDDTFLKPYNFTSETVYTMFIPNTYDFYWNTSAKLFVEKMYKSYIAFWTAEKQEKAKNLGLSPTEVTILASIVDEEALFNDEMPRIAGVYLNRLAKDMLLQADPTVKFAEGDFSIKRIRGAMLSNTSKYNTYVHKGLPPGPIAMPSVAAINAVLGAESHNYLYFCAKEDFSGRHRFAETGEEHMKNAKLYQEALN